MNYTPVIGLEIHAELLTKSKLFCSCENSFGGEPNTKVCPVCTGQPGSLPVLNREALALAIKAGLSVNGEIHTFSSFDRKNYFYPDLPKAYQITQNYHPICTGGNIGKIRINNIHIEEDAGKLIHKDGGSEIDLNRSGVPLIEIVTEPDFRSSDEVCSFLSDLSRRLKFSGVCDAKMEEGSLRVDVNISLMGEDDTVFGTRAEIKNINSFKSIKKAIDFEIKRQTEILSHGGSIVQQTRRFDEKTGETVLMRKKEDMTDYRYFPEPDIPAILIDEKDLLKIKSEMPELPNEKFLRYVNDFKIPEQDAYLLISDKDFSDFFEACVNFLNEPLKISRLMLGELSHRLNMTGLKTEDLKFSPKDFSDLINLENKGQINKAEQKEILKAMFETGDSPKNILKTVKKEVSEVDIKNKLLSLINENPKLVSEYKQGNTKCIDFFIGQIIRSFGKSVDPNLCREIIVSILFEI